MLKFFFWILLLANAGLFAYQQGYLDTMLPSGREPARMSNQINAEKIRLVPAPAPAPEPAPVVESVAQKEEVPACTEIGNFTPDDARRFSAQLAPLALGERVSQRTIQGAVTHIVYIPPQPGKEAAEKKAGELRELGVNDFFLIQDNSDMRWGISLGVFKAEEAARAYLARLSQTGVRSARIGQRKVTSSLVAFQFRELDATASGAIEKIRGAFPKQEMRACGAA